MKSVIASIILLAGITHAQFDGLISVREGECPKFEGTEASQPISYSQVNICDDLSRICPEGRCFVGVSALATGANQQAPLKMGACPGSDCAADCVTWDVESVGNGFRVDCGEFTGQHYFYLGV
ncbi:hypothetical protein FZEAL_6775 [Fusarium zealandicum]|uniref:Uncharacterized protein n=1 Tax=Fusarium zealandicum TaxID=1053134 RepID=A0A8H4XIJ3_9HYPO|nr:hypothetical protein FZEAL_6775 [Fusarium zealandicum]